MRKEIGREEAGRRIAAIPGGAVRVSVTRDRSRRGRARPALFACALLCLLLGFAPLIPAAEAAEAPPLIPEEWFDDALFIGDSMTGSLRSHCLRFGGLGEAKLIYVNGLACHNIVRQDQKVGYMGRSCSPEEAAELAGAKKVFFLLAANDVGTPTDELEACWTALIDRMLTRCPGTRIFLQSGTPFRGDVAYFSRENLNDYNDMLRRLCAEKGCVFVDINPGLLTEDGFMKEEYRLDIEDNVHMNSDGCAVWVANLRSPASYSVPPLKES